MWVAFALISVVGIVSVGYVILPLFGQARTVDWTEREELADLTRRKEVALEAIRELEFDHSVGKIEDEDFERFNRLLRHRAMRLIEWTDAEFGGAEGLGPEEVQMDELLEIEISNRRRVEEAPPDEGSSRLPEE